MEERAGSLGTIQNQEFISSFKHSVKDSFPFPANNHRERAGSLRARPKATKALKTGRGPVLTAAPAKAQRPNRVWRLLLLGFRTGPGTMQKNEGRSFKLHNSQTLAQLLARRLLGASTLQSKDKAKLVTAQRPGQMFTAFRVLPMASAWLLATGPRQSALL